MSGSLIFRKTTTGFPPCALRILKEDYVVVGTYELDKATGYRKGTIEVYDSELRLKNTYPTYAAILDLKLSPHVENLIATAHSTGNVMLWKFDLGGLKELANLQVFQTDVLITSLNFSPLNANSLVLTTTTGSIMTIDIAVGNCATGFKLCESLITNMDTKIYEVQGTMQRCVDIVEKYDEFERGHTLECWTSEFGSLSPLENVVFSGGDDCAIMAHDLRSKSFIWYNNTVHEGGVVAIKAATESFRRNMPTSLLTGSYDDTIRSFDLRMLGNSIFPGEGLRPLNIEELNLEGGVWRFSESPLNKESEDVNNLVVCCMYNGAKVVSVNGHKIETLAHEKDGHDSICYGCDWSNEFIATCSFYDKSLQLWNI
ncbi:HER035Wp [Eremothecium sinecaudum]|uniref:methylated diphthine methylhydrolase n=1 Tax=Eremothecium sinecaudum TaxID=45286 RepID=A0A0X8HTQ6_9SACH|nr:HER035Wp [Eremothecium sinecaudum]AMD21314.1 HER035Wp [Eremothecium sinecaudum]